MKNKEFKLRLYSKKILAITDFADMCEALNGEEKIDAKAKLPEKPGSELDFQ
jgi:hypothetical protein